MRVIGIDPGIERTGFAVIEQKGSQIFLRDYGLITTSKTHSLAERLEELGKDLLKILKKWHPQKSGLERIYFSKNVKTAVTVAHARGVIMHMLSQHNVEICEFNPSDIKIAVTGSGSADKHQVKKMLHYLVGLTPKNDDMADAIASGICTLTTHLSR